MQNKSEFKIDYSPEVQKWFLKMMLTDAQLYTRVANIINAENFDKSLRPVVQLFKDSAEKYSTIPEPEFIQASTGIKLEQIENITPGHTEKFLEEFEKFTKRQELERAILKAADMLEKGDRPIKIATLLNIPLNMVYDVLEQLQAEELYDPFDTVNS